MIKKKKKKIWDLIKQESGGFKSKGSIDELYRDDSFVSNKADVANAFNNHFACVGTEVASMVKQIKTNPVDLILEQDSSLAMDLGTTGPIHFCDILKSLASNTSLDLDSISMKLLKSLSTYISVPVSHIFNLSLTKGIFPKNLKTSRVVPIFKSGDPKNVDNYRPIALVSTLAKVLEKIVAIRLFNYLDINKLLYKHQYGFVKGRSTEQSLLQVTNFISSALNENKYCISIFLDIKKAFDTVDHQILLGKLKKLGIKGTALLWFESYLSERMQVVDIDGTLSPTKTINIGVLQGSVLGPLLFLCFINDFPLSTILLTILFADDTTVLDQDDDLAVLINRCNTEMQKIALWFRANKLVVNANKTKFMIFHTRGKKVNLNGNTLFFNANEINAPVDPNLIVTLERIHNGNTSSLDKTFKLLGVLLDENLSFEPHISYTCNKISRAIFCLNRIKNFMPTKLLRNIYFALVHPHFLYCSIILSCATQTNIKRLVKLQKKAIRIIAKAKYNEHTKDLFLLHDILPFSQIIKQSKLLFMHSIKYNYAPESFSNMFPINQHRTHEHDLRNNDDFMLPRVNFDFIKRMPIYTLPLEWNSFGDNKFQPNRFTFKKATFNVLMDELRNS